MAHHRFVLAVAVLAAPAIAHADNPDETTDSKAWPTDATRRPLTLRAGMIELGAGALTSISSMSRYEPTALVFDVGYGITSDITAQLRLGDLPGPFETGVGVCVTSGCPSRIGGVGANVVYHLLTMLEGQVDVALDGGGKVDALDPTRARAHVGAQFRYAGGAMGLAVTIDPQLELGVTDRGMTNPDALVIPVHVHMPVAGVLDSFAGITYGLPMTTGVERVRFLDLGTSFVPVAVSRDMDIGIRARFALTDEEGGQVVSLFARVRK